MKYRFERRVGVWLASLACSALMGTAWADADPSSNQRSNMLDREPLTGDAVYQQYCQACHMSDAKGATGAGYFPALAGNPLLAAAGYPVYVILHGQGGMPWFNGMLKDEEIAAVVNYIRSHFGNQFPDPISAADVAQMRGPVPVEQ